MLLHLSGLLLFVFEIGTHYVADWPEELVLQVSVTSDFCPSLSFSFLAVLACANQTSTLSCASLEQHRMAHKSPKNSLVASRCPFPGTLASFSVALGVRKD